VILKSYIRIKIHKAHKDEKKEKKQENCQPTYKAQKHKPAYTQSTNG
jgi:hypothetical protein